RLDVGDVGRRRRTRPAGERARRRGRAAEQDRDPGQVRRAQRPGPAGHRLVHRARRVQARHHPRGHLRPLPVRPSTRPGRRTPAPLRLATVRTSPPLRRLTPTPEGSTSMAWDFSTDPEFQRKLDWMTAFVRDEVRPLETLDLTWPQLRTAIAPLQQQVKDQQLWAAHLGPELGGQGYGQVKLGLMHEILGSTPYGPLVFGCQAPDSGNAEILAAAGTDEQKRRWLDPLLAGEMYSAFALTEPDNAGADPTNLSTTAVRDGDGWVLNGHKWFISNAATADFVIVVAVTDPDAERHRRASQFIVPIDA